MRRLRILALIASLAIGLVGLSGSASADGGWTPNQPVDPGIWQQPVDPGTSQ